MARQRHAAGLQIKAGSATAMATVAVCRRLGRADGQHTDRIAGGLVSPRASSPGSSGAPSLQLPLGLRIDAVTVAELQLDDAAPWHDVHASVFLGDNEGTEHRVQGLSLHNDRLRLSADARIGTAAPLPLTLQLRATPVTGTPWQASASADGPLTDFTVRASLRGDERSANAPNVDVLARIEPFADWPLASLQLSTRSLDLAALSSAAPRTRIDAQAPARRARPPRGASVRANLNPGWDGGRVPCECSWNRRHAQSARSHRDPAARRVVGR
jgi:translocation and assembly module TamB